MTEVFLNRIGTAVPANDVHQLFAELAVNLLPDERIRRVFRRMADRSGISRRYSVLPLGPADEPDLIDGDGLYRYSGFANSADRMARYEAEALPLALRAVSELGSRETLGKITHVIVTSCTGFYAPGLDLQLIAALDLDRSVERTVVGFMGCYAAFNALKLARHIVRSEPPARVLLVNLELCTLHLQRTADLEQVLSFMLFADGCAASLVTADPVGLRLDSFHAALLPDSADLITWRIGTNGFDMLLSGRVPGAISAALPAAAPAILGDVGAREIDLWAIHPGGRSVLDAVQESLGLSADALSVSRSVLRDFGNMSSVTILFVLGRMMQDAPARSSGCAIGFGPGLVAESMRFTTAKRAA